MTYSATTGHDGREVQGYARIVLRRDRGGLVFCTARWSEETTQLVFERQTTEEFENARKIPLGSLVAFAGITGTTMKGAPAIFVRRFTLAGANERGFPDKWHGLSQAERYRNRALDLITNEEAFEFAKFISSSVMGLRTTLARHGYREFSTGTLQERFEGGLAEPFSTKANFNGKTYYLSLTSELKLKRLILAGFDRVFEIAQTFRNEGVNAICSPEHTLLESYAVGDDLEGRLKLVEELVRQVAGERDPDGRIVFSDKEDVRSELDFTRPFERMTFARAYQAYVDPNAQEPNLDRLIELRPDLFVSGMPRYTWLMKAIESLISPHLLQPTFLTDLPSGMSPFVKTRAKDPAVSERAFLVCGGLFIADIYVDENDPAVLAPALRAQAEAGQGTLNPEFLDMLGYGMPPTAGFGLGLKRMALLFRKDLPFNIKETILFPL